MRRRTFGVWVLSATLWSAVLPAASPAGVRSLNEAFAKALKAGDLDALMRLHDPDAVLWPPGEKEQRGEEEIRFKWSRVLKANNVTEVLFQNVTAMTSGNVSIGWGRVTLSLKPKSGEEPVTISGRFSAVAKLRNGRWLYVFVSVAELDEILTFRHYSKEPASGRLKDQ